MKCQQCSTDAPAETDPESGRLRCSHCKAFWGTGTNQSAVVRQARDILQKWSSADLLDEISRFPSIPPLKDAGDPVSETSSEDSGAADAKISSEDPQQHEQTDRGRSSEILSLTEALRRKQRTDASQSAADDSDAESDEPSAADPLPTASSAASSDTAPSDTRSSDTDAVSSGATRDSEPGAVVSVDSRSDADADAPASSAASGPPAAANQPAATDHSAGAPPSAPPSKSRRAVRRALPRRATAGPASPPGSDSAEPRPVPDSTFQGMDTVKKTYRLDQPGPVSISGPADAAVSPDSSADEQAVDPRAQDATSARRFRIDSAQSMHELADSGTRVRGQGRSRRRYVDEAHEAIGMRGPHFDLTPPPRSSLTSLTGQILAYIGVLGLTVGTAIVIYGHFGGMSEYTPTGWLVTTVAQMLLFLGVINLVSGGIEQNNYEVSHRINVLGEQLLRIEQVTENVLRGPKIPAERYAGGPTAESAEPTVPASADALHEPS